MRGDQWKCTDIVDAVSKSKDTTNNWYQSSLKILGRTHSFTAWHLDLLTIWKKVPVTYEVLLHLGCCLCRQWWRGLMFGNRAAVFPSQRWWWCGRLDKWCCIVFVFANFRGQRHHSPSLSPLHPTFDASSIIHMQPFLNLNDKVNICVKHHRLSLFQILLLNQHEPRRSERSMSLAL